MPHPSSEPVNDLVSFLSARSVLLVLDNCEHLIDVIAQLADTLLRAAPRLHVLVTSREALRIENEYVRRQAPQECPTPAAGQYRDKA